MPQEAIKKSIGTNTIDRSKLNRIYILIDNEYTQLRFGNKIVIIFRGNRKSGLDQNGVQISYLQFLILFLGSEDTSYHKACQG